MKDSILPKGRSLILLGFSEYIQYIMYIDTYIYIYTYTWNPKRQVQMDGNGDVQAFFM